MRKYIVQFQPPAQDYPALLVFRNEMEKESFQYVAGKLKKTLPGSLKPDLYQRKATTIKEINDAVFRVLYKAGKRYSFTVRLDKFN